MFQPRGGTIINYRNDYKRYRSSRHALAIIIRRCLLPGIPTTMRFPYAPNIPPLKNAIRWGGTQLQRIVCFISPCLRESPHGDIALCLGGVPPHPVSFLGGGVPPHLVAFLVPRAVSPNDPPTTPIPDPTPGSINACSGGGRRAAGACIYPSWGSPRGVPLGIPRGVPWGIPWGIPWGVPWGGPWGAPWGGVLLGVSSRIWARAFWRG